MLTYGGVVPDAAETLPLFPVVRQVDPARFAAEQHRLFAGQNLRIGRSAIVHAVDFRDWINSLSLPFPACHQGWSGLGAAGELLPTRHPVTCVKCRRLRGLLDEDQAEALVLFNLPGKGTDDQHTPTSPTPALRRPR